MNENWYDQAQGQGNTEFKPEQPAAQGESSAQVPGTEQPAHKPARAKREKARISIGALIACLLVAALLGGTAGGAIVYNGAKAQLFASLQQQEQQNAANEALNMSTGSLEEYDISTVASKCMPSIVGIEISVQQQSYFGREQTATGSGSGVILTADGYIATNNHVVGGASSIKVYLQDGTSYDATLVGTDSRTDLAVVKIAATGLVPAVIGSSADLKVGDQVIAIGNPLGELMSTVTGGYISGLNRTIVVENQEMTLLQTDAAINPGNSGGGLFNTKGELIGIVNAKSMGFDVEGLGFAIPIDSATKVLNELVQNGYVSGRPYLGVSMQEVYLNASGDTENQNPLNGFGSQYEARVQVVEVVAGSAAEKAGLQAGDMITAVDGTKVEGMDQLTSLIGEYNAGDVVKLSIERGQKQLELTVTLGEKTNAG
ncbi:MAG: trypsin-like peptidase domain-containing protein [Bacillota bacterium]